MPLNPNTAKLVVVAWSDITEYAQWNQDVGDDEDEEITTVSSVGWLIEDRAQWVKIARDYSWEAEKWSGVVMIPKLPPEVEIVKEAE